MDKRHEESIQNMEAQMTNKYRKECSNSLLIEKCTLDDITKIYQNGKIRKVSNVQYW